jgi:O-antigen ligase
MFSQQKKMFHWVFLPLGVIVFYMLILGQSESGYVGILLSFGLLFPFLAKSSKITGRLLTMLSVCLLSIWLSVKVHNSNWDASVWSPIAPYLPALSAFICILGIILWLLPTISFQKKAFYIGWYSLTLLILILGIRLIPHLAETSNHKTIQAANEIIQGNFDDSLGSNRMFIWKRSLTMVPERLWLGHGPDNFYLSFTFRYGKEAVEKNFVRYDKVHNEYIQNLFDNGVLGLSALLAFYGIALYVLRKKRNTHLSLAVFLSLVCFMVQAFFNFSSPFAHPIVWAMWGICSGLGYQHNDNDFIMLEE